MASWYAFTVEAVVGSRVAHEHDPTKDFVGSGGTKSWATISPASLTSLEEAAGYDPDDLFQDGSGLMPMMQFGGPFTATVSTTDFGFWSIE